MSGFSRFLSNLCGDDKMRALQKVYEQSSKEFRANLEERARSIEEFTGPEGMLLGLTPSQDDEGLNIRIPWGRENARWLIQGGTGTGKTTWQIQLFEQKFPKGFCGGIDCKGDLHPNLVRVIAGCGLKLDREAREALRSRLLVVDPFSSALVPLNICRVLPGYTAEFQAYELALVLRRLFQGDLTAHAENLLRHLLLLLMEAGLSLVEAPMLLQNEVLRSVLAMRNQNAGVKEFFLRAYSSLPQVSKDSLLNRLQALLLPENIRLMLGANDLIDLRSAFEEGKLLLVFLGKGLSIPEEQVNVLGSLILQMVFQATYARVHGKRQSYLLMIDEFVNLLEGTALANRFATALTAARSFGLHLMLSHHSFVQVPSALRQTVLANADLISVFRTSAESAAAFGDFMPESDIEQMTKAYAAGRCLSKTEIKGYQLESIQRLPNREFFWYDRRHINRSIRLRTPEFIPPHLRLRISEKRFEELIEEQGWTCGSAGIRREELRRQIADRQERLQQMLRPSIDVRPDSEPENKGKPQGKSRRPRLG
ncbi:MAG TPA: type IV secretory system conjugative DNA transfer family protein [Terriglobia bacterium]|nr:type IV secretory system conjugative DNA transfer family protein [Terriglobia bacterium]